jgi:hypothetical protein
MNLVGLAQVETGGGRLGISSQPSGFHKMRGIF